MNEHTLGSICAGIGGFDLGFEQAGWETVWQIELDDVNRHILADRFPRARQFKDLRDWRSFNLPRVKAIAFGFPCQDISIMANHGARKGLAGSRSGLFFKIMEIVKCLQPAWLAIENVPALLTSNNCQDFESVISSLAQCGYLGFFRVLDAQYFGVPQKRRRLFMVAGLGRHPSSEFLADSRPVVSLPCAIGPEQARAGAAWAGYTLTAPDKLNHCNSRTNLSSELLVAEEERWHQMAERSRAAEIHGFSRGLDRTNTEQAYAAGNAVCPPIAKWIAEILKTS